MTENQYLEPVRLAHLALTAHLDGDKDQAAAIVATIDREHGSGGIVLALMAWCDTVKDHADDGMFRGKPTGARVFHLNPGTGAIGDQASPELRWAGELIAARHTLDVSTFKAALHKLNDVPEAVGIAPYIWAVLYTASFNLRHLPRGYGVLGLAS